LHNAGRGLGRDGGNGIEAVFRFRHSVGGRERRREQQTNACGCGRNDTQRHPTTPSLLFAGAASMN
jgi:hypothetical protein